MRTHSCARRRWCGAENDRQRTSPSEGAALLASCPAREGILCHSYTDSSLTSVAPRREPAARSARPAAAALLTDAPSASPLASPSVHRPSGAAFAGSRRQSNAPSYHVLHAL